MRASWCWCPVLALLLMAFDARADTDDVSLAGPEQLADESGHQGLSHFPNEAGCHWTYSAKWELWDRIDTIQVTVDTATLTGAGIPGTVWSNAPWRQVPGIGYYPTELWVAAISDSSSDLDTIALFGSPADTVPDLLFVIPFDVGSRWKWLDLGGGADSSFEGVWVDSVTQVETPCGTFADVIHLTRRYFKPYGSRDDLNIDTGPMSEGQDGKIEYWIKPGVGLVRMEQVHKMRGRPMKFRLRWELLDYHIAGVDPDK